MADKKDLVAALAGLVVDEQRNNGRQEGAAHADDGVANDDNHRSDASENLNNEAGGSGSRDSQVRRQLSSIASTDVVHFCCFQHWEHGKSQSFFYAALSAAHN
jgi:hypothetical protein